MQIWKNKWFFILPSKKTGSSLQNWRNKYFHYSTKQTNFLNILGLLCGFEKKNHYSTKHKKTLWIYVLWLLCRIEPSGFIILLSKETLIKYPVSSLQNFKKNVLKITWRNLHEYPGSSDQKQDPGCLRTDVRGDCKINRTKHFNTKVQ